MKRVIVILIFCSAVLAGQVDQGDSLKRVVKEIIAGKRKVNDTITANILNNLVEILPDEEWPIVNENLGRFLDSTFKKGTIPERYYVRQLESVIANKGFYAQQKGKLSAATDYYTQALVMCEKIGDEYGVATLLNNIGAIFSELGEQDKAISYYNRALQIRLRTKDTLGLITEYGNLAVVYDKKKDLRQAYKYYMLSLTLSDENKLPAEMSTALTNTGYFLSKYGDPECGDSKEACLKSGRKRAIELFKRCLAVEERFQLKDRMAHTYLILANLYFNQNEIPKALEFSRKSFDIANEIGFTEHIMNSSNLLYSIYKFAHHDKEAYEMYDIFIHMRDSLNNESNRKNSIKKEMQYEYEKKAAADSVKAAEEKKVVQAQLKQEKTQRYSLYGGLALVLLFALFMVNRFRVTNKQKKLIEEQKKIVEMQKELVTEKQKEILDSIRYAKRIQTALMSSEFYVNKELKRMKL